MKMILKSLKKDQKGFSLIELMIVVAIIGILAAVAVPNFTQFQRKARQSEGRGLLTSAFMANKAFFAEYNTYHSDFTAVGFRPEGVLKYFVALNGAALATYPTAYPTAPRNSTYFTTGAFCTAPNSMTADRPCTMDSAAPSTSAAASINGVAGPAIITTTPGNFNFVFTATALIGGTQADIWGIDSRKTLSNTQSGL